MRRSVVVVMMLVDLVVYDYAGSRVDTVSVAGPAFEAAR